MYTSVGHGTISLSLTGSDVDDSTMTLQLCPTRMPIKSRLRLIYGQTEMQYLIAPTLGPDRSVQIRLHFHKVEVLVNSVQQECQ